MGGALGRMAAAGVALSLALVPAADAKLRPGDLLVTDDDNSRVLQVSKSGSVSVFSNNPKMNDPSQIAFTPDRRVIVTDEFDDGPRIFSLTAKGKLRTLVSTNLDQPYGAAYSGLHGLIVADYGRQALLRVVGRNRTRVLADDGMFDDPIGVASAPDGTPFLIEQDFFEGDCGSNCGGVIRIAPNGTQHEVTSGGLFDDPTDGIVGADRAIWVADQSGLPDGDGTVVRVGPNGNQIPIASDPSIIGNGIALDFKNNPIVSTETGVARVDGLDNLVEIAPIAGAPNDVAVVPPTCGGKWATIVGTNGPDQIKASRGKDVIATLGGDDVVRAGGKNDIVCGGGGADTLNGNAGNDLAVGGGGNDSCRAERERSC